MQKDFDRNIVDVGIDGLGPVGVAKASSATYATNASTSKQAGTATYAKNIPSTVATRLTALETNTTNVVGPNTYTTNVVKNEFESSSINGLKFGGYWLNPDNFPNARLLIISCLTTGQASIYMYCVTSDGIAYLEEITHSNINRDDMNYPVLNLTSSGLVRVRVNVNTTSITVYTKIISLNN